MDSIKTLSLENNSAQGNFRRRSPFMAIFAHEARMLWRTGGALILFAILAFWMGLAVRGGLMQQERQQALAQRLKAKDAAVLKKNYEAFIKDPQGYRGKAYTASLLWRQNATLPPGPLAALDAGQSDLRPSAYALHTDWEKVFLNSGPLRNESALRSGNFDAGFLVVYLLPLAVIALSFGLLDGDREKGTMLLLLSQPVSPGLLLAASLLVRFLLLEAIVLGSAALFVYSGLGADASLLTLPHFLLWSLAVTAYLAFWFAVAAFVVASGGKAAINALVLVMCWVFFTIALPAGIATMADARYAVPPRSEIMRQVNVARDEAFENWRDNEKSFRLFYKDFPDLVPVGATITPQKIIDPLTEDSDFQSRVMIVIPYAIEQLGLKLSQPHREALQNRLEFIRGARLWSPVVATREGLMDIAGSSDARYAAFDAQVAAFWKEWRYNWVKRMFRGPNLTPEEYHQVPQFAFAEESISVLAVRTLPGIGATLVLTLVLSFCATTLLRRRNQSPLPSN